MIKITRQTHNISGTSRTKVHFIVLSTFIVILGGLLTLLYNATNTQLLLAGTGLLVAVLLAVPELLIYCKRRTPRLSWTDKLMPDLPFEPEQASSLLPVTTTLGMEAIIPQQIKPNYINQSLPVLESEAVNGINSSQLAFWNTGVPVTPLQRVPPTPFFGNVPVIPQLPLDPQGGLLTRYTTQSRPRRIALIRPPDTTKRPKISIPNPREAAPKMPDKNC